MAASIEYEVGHWEDLTKSQQKSAQRSKRESKKLASQPRIRRISLGQSIMSARISQPLQQRESP